MTLRGFGAPRVFAFSTRSGTRFDAPVYRDDDALLQSYLATGQAIDGLIEDAGLDWRSERQVRFACGLFFASW